MAMVPKQLMQYFYLTPLIEAEIHHSQLYKHYYYKSKIIIIIIKCYCPNTYGTNCICTFNDTDLRFIATSRALGCWWQTSGSP